jgi:hypothetical protein
MSSPFATHRAACLALLNSGADLNRKTGQFLGGSMFDEFLSEKQLKWLTDLLKKNGLPPLAREVSDVG